jgi:four helix bundle protein
MRYALCALRYAFSIHFLWKLGSRMAKFRFQDLEIWKMAIEIAEELLDIADELEQKHLYRFAEQLRASGLGMSNNIAEGSGSESNRVFSRYLDIARASAYENANVTIILYRRKLLTEEKSNHLLERLDHLCRKITNFKKTIGA